MTQVLGEVSRSWTLDKHQQTQEAFLQSLDPRVRLLVCVLFSCVVSALHDMMALTLALGIGLGLSLFARLPIWTTVRKVVVVDSFILVLVLTLPFTMPGEVIFSFWGWEASREGLFRAAEVGLKANAILFSLMALIGIMEPSVLGHALYRLKIPIKLVHLFLFTVRYIDVFYKEYKTMRMAMKARGFVPRTDLHTLRSIGYLVGMMLVRSLERSDRIMEAMKCRGFDGRFYILDTMKSGPRDRIFAVVSAVTLLGLLAVGYL
ncbi:cobalt ECF transporter T component CbiQ [Kiloniella laminariae]|uniref:Cobalt ECF transporter T component CbiQ n=1 Tax=Kiloniella laminariae TaxID=454162 RepID=A0ABT4LPH2_9PROT|nr:cobalt ECF transporter T component CbiQ [Kiloniella laminariae]MCZ4283024.1 cobalt ECF transporter T component CbiQ [Kiloniella laminariae]